nr:YccS family putative transporter [uncultured Tolumonas sp.]
MLAFSRFLQRFITDTHVFFALKVSCALAVILLPGLYLSMIHQTVAMSLGIVAGAIAEPDDSLSGRIKSLLLTLACFWIATLSVQLLFPYPWLFAAGLFCSTWFFIMLGGLGKRYSSISFGSLLVAVYSMMGAAQAPTIWFQPVWLCTGALWYGFISLCWLRATPNKPLREQLAQTCFSLARYCTQKAWLFPSSADEQPSIHQKLAILNVDCMASINLCQEMIARRTEHPDQELQQLIALQAINEQIHERITSSHYLYNRLKEDVHSNRLLDGFREQLRQLGSAVQQLGYATLMNNRYEISPGLLWGMQALGDQLQFSHEKTPFSASTVNALRFLQKNLQEIVTLLDHADETIKASAKPQNKSNQGNVKSETISALQQIWSHLSFKSPLFRHACRMSLCLVTGYGLLALFDIKQGFWVLLTCLFVCQSSYTATRRRLFQRIAGTCCGLLLSLPLLWFSPTPGIQLILMAIAAILFFAQLRSNYSLAVIFITLYAMTAFGLLGVEEKSIILPRFVDTLLGSILSFGAVTLLWPEWQFQRIPELLAKATRCNSEYMKAIVSALQTSTQDSLFNQKRIAAHHADSALAQAWVNMQTDPKQQRRYTKLCAALIYRNHSLLSYVSALGVHQELHGSLFEPQLIRYAEFLFQALDESVAALSGKNNDAPIDLSSLSSLPATDKEACTDQRAGLIQQEMNLIGIMTGEILKLSRLLRPLIQSHGPDKSRFWSR